MIKVLLGIALGVLLCIVVPSVVLALGLVNMGADTTPSAIEQTFAPWAVDRLMERRAPKEPNPYTADPAAVAAGLQTYANNCVLCHGAPGVEAADLSKGLNPTPPSLADESDVSDGELFWIIKHGIRMTGMAAFGPTHSDEQMWKVVAFIRHLPSLTPQEQQVLRSKMQNLTGLSTPQEINPGQK